MIEWISVEDRLPEMEYLYPEYLPRDQRASSEHDILVRGKLIEYDWDWDDSIDESVQIKIETWVYSVARIRRTWNLKTNDGWSEEWDCHNDEFWYDYGVKVTHWTKIA